MPLIVGDIDSILKNKLWAWTWAGETGQNLTLGTGSNGKPIILQANDLSNNGRHWTNNTGASVPGYRQGVSYDNNTKGGTWSTTYGLLGIDKYPDGTQHFGNVYHHNEFKAAGDFYVGVVFANTRTSGERELLGTDSINYFRIDQQRDAATICIRGHAFKVVPNGGIAKGVQYIEILRDEQFNIAVNVNGALVGQVTQPGAWNLKGTGFDGVGTSQWDDDLFEIIMSKQLPDPQEIADVEDKVAQRWLIGVL